MNELMEILKSVRSDVDFAHETAMIDDGILESFDIITIVGEINDVFGVNIDAGDLLPENFNSVENMWALIESLR